MTLRRGGRDVVRDLSGSFAPGTLTAVAGPNGAGKSTLVAGYVRSVAGGLRTHRCAAAWTRGRSRCCRRTDASTVRFRSPAGTSSRWAGPLAWACSAGLGASTTRLPIVLWPRWACDGLGSRSIGALSAGQFQRVLFARTIVRDAPVILLDEPFSAVDATTEADLMAIVRLWHRQGRTVVAVLHDLDLIRAEFPQTLLMGSGRMSGEPRTRC